jgi:ribonuclease HI
MKKQIINYIVLIALAVMANYPIYKDLQQSVEVAQSTINNAMSVVAQVDKNVNQFKSKIDTLENDLLGLYIRADITKAELLAELDTTLKNIEHIQFETHALNQRLNQLANNALDKVVEDKKVDKILDKKDKKLNEIIPGLPGFK